MDLLNKIKMVQKISCYFSVYVGLSMGCPAAGLAPQDCLFFGFHQIALSGYSKQ
jgi:hypothetical protein